MRLPDAWEESLRDLDDRLARQGSRSRALAPASRAGYVRDCRRVATWLAQHGVAQPADITPSMLEAALRDIGWAPATRRRALTALREWLRPYFARGRSPAALLDAPRPDRAPVPRLSQAEAAALADLAARAVGEAPPKSTARALALRDRISHQDLAHAVGSTRETITKLLGDFRARGLLDLGYRRIVLTDRAGLEQAARQPLGPLDS
jgi:site-specific recombinase XerD